MGFEYLRQIDISIWKIWWSLWKNNKKGNIKVISVQTNWEQTTKSF